MWYTPDSTIDRLLGARATKLMCLYSYTTYSFLFKGFFQLIINVRRAAQRGATSLLAIPPSLWLSEHVEVQKPSSCSPFPSSECADSFCGCCMLIPLLCSKHCEFLTLVVKKRSEGEKMAPRVARNWKLKTRVTSLESAWFCPARPRLNSAFPHQYQNLCECRVMLTFIQ